MSGIGKDLSKGGTEDDCILPFAVLDDVISKVEEVQSVIVVRWKGMEEDGGVTAGQVRHNYSHCW